MIYWQAVALFLGILAIPSVPFLAFIGLQELWDRAYMRGNDDAWQRAIDAQTCGKRLV